MDTTDEIFCTETPSSQGGVMTRLIRFFVGPPKHTWQTRGQNRYGTPTYRVCLKCRESQKRVNKPFEDDKWAKCEPIPELDSQFDENDNFIWSES